MIFDGVYRGLENELAERRARLQQLIREVRDAEPACVMLPPAHPRAREVGGSLSRARVRSEPDRHAAAHRARGGALLRRTLAPAGRGVLGRDRGLGVADTLPRPTALATQLLRRERVMLMARRTQTMRDREREAKGVRPRGTGDSVCGPHVRHRCADDDGIPSITDASVAHGERLTSRCVETAVAGHRSPSVGTCNSTPRAYYLHACSLAVRPPCRSARRACRRCRSWSSGSSMRRTPVCP